MPRQSIKISAQSQQKDDGVEINKGLHLGSPLVQKASVPHITCHTGRASNVLFCAINLVLPRGFSKGKGRAFVQLIESVDEPQNIGFRSFAFLHNTINLILVEE
jgi:hypothetical protein